MPFFYRHYKNKDYKYIGTAKHSETLEELAVYECLYDNPLATLWVRPKEMFDSMVQIDGQEKRRFAPVTFDIRAVSSLNEQQRQALSALAQKFFADLPFATIEERLQFKKAQLLLAYLGEELVGFKMGYEVAADEYYSWLGGVDSAWRGRGVASQLMRVQHEWCRGQNYKYVSTKTKNSFREMLILNLHWGFNVVGIEEAVPEIKILLKKSLASL